MFEDFPIYFLGFFFHTSNGIWIQLLEYNF